MTPAIMIEANAIDPFQSLVFILFTSRLKEDGPDEKGLNFSHESNYRLAGAVREVKSVPTGAIRTASIAGSRPAPFRVAEPHRH